MYSNNNSSILQVVLVTIAIGIWVLVLQNAGIFPKNQNVIVVNEVEANVRGHVDAEVYGTVEVDNTVDINVQAINGHYDVFFNNPSRGEREKYYLLPVVVE